MLAARFAGYDSSETKAVLEILRRVAEGGDKAVAYFTHKHDHVKLKPDQFRVKEEDLKRAHEELARGNPAVLESLRKAIGNVRQYQQKIFIGSNSRSFDGVGIKYTPIKRVGVCVPGAAAPLPSTVIMSAVPAQVAGVREIAVVSPPRYNDGVHPVTLAVCHELAITEVYRVGGAQAVAALAHGTATIEKVDKVVGPGNKWVQAAKKNVSGDHVAIDSIAGPSDVLVLANAQANAAWVAADMLSQAEHASDSSAILLTHSEELAQKVLQELGEQVGHLSRSKEAIESLKGFGRIIVVKSFGEAVELANTLAAEHVEIHCGRDSRKIAEQIENAGAIFIGPYTPVAVGDYWAGPSHTLPTGARAKFSSALTSNDFVKSISIIEYDEGKLLESAEDIIRLAETEGLDAHAKSVRIRQED